MPPDPRASRSPERPDASSSGASSSGASSSGASSSGASSRRGPGEAGQVQRYPADEPLAPSSFLRPQNRVARLALGAMGILVLAVCAAVTVSVAAAVLPSLRAAQQPTATTSAGPTTVVSQFCNDELAQHYTQAYALFSSHLQTQLTQTQFVQRAQQLDASKGTVTQCEPVQGGEAALTPTSESFDMAVGRTLQGTTTDYSGTIGVVKSGSVWSIDSLDTSLELT